MDELLDRDEVVAAVNFWSAIVHRQCSIDDNLLSYGKGALCLFCPFLVVEIEAAEYLDHLAGNSLSIFRDRICCITVRACINATYLADDSGSINLIRCIFTSIDEFERVGHSVRFFPWFHQEHSALSQHHCLYGSESAKHC